MSNYATEGRGIREARGSERSGRANRVLSQARFQERRGSAPYKRNAHWLMPPHPEEQGRMWPRFKRPNYPPYLDQTWANQAWEDNNEQWFEPLDSGGMRGRGNQALGRGRFYNY